MNIKEVVALMQLTQGATVIGAKYIDDDGVSLTKITYHFKNVLQLNIAVDDLVVVQTKNNFKLVKVVSVNVPHYTIGCNVDELKHVVQKVDLSNLNRILAAEQRAASELAVSELHERLNTMRSQIGDDSMGRVRNLLAPTIAEFTAAEYPDAVVEDMVTEAMTNEFGSPPSFFTTRHQKAVPDVYSDEAMMGEMTRPPYGGKP